MTKPRALAVVPAAIPEAVKAFPQWVLWRYEQKNTRWTKPPYRINGKRADKTNQDHWSEFSEVMAAYEEGGYDGIGFCVTEKDPFTFLDIDHCVDGQGADAHALEVIHSVASYCEKSPSGEGLRIITKANLPRNLKQKRIEIYDHDWYLTITGQLFGNAAPLEHRQSAIDSIFQRAATSAAVNGLGPDCRNLVDRIRNSKQGALFDKLMSGKIDGYGSHSEADLALCSILAFWSGNNSVRIDTLFRVSSLYRPKWDTRHGKLTYGQLTTNKALSITGPPKKQQEGKQKERLKPLPVVITASQLLSRSFPPRENLLSPWLQEQGLCLLHAYRGVGKTHISLGIACAVATGSSFLKWEAERPAGVLFIDGEMPAVTIQERIAGTLATMDGAKADNLHILTPGLQEGCIPDLGSKEGQEQIDQVLTDDIKLIILDNISTICRSTSENKSDSWSPVQEWALRMRSRGKSVLLVHHDGKGGMQRGSSRKEDVLDTVIQLTRPKSYTPDQGAMFEVHFRKNRGLHGDEVKPFEARLTTGEEGNEWKLKTIEESIADKITKLLDEGYSQKDIAEELEISKGYTSKLVKKIRAAA